MGCGASRVNQAAALADTVEDLPKDNLDTVAAVQAVDTGARFAPGTRLKRIGSGLGSRRKNPLKQTTLTIDDTPPGVVPTEQGELEAGSGAGEQNDASGSLIMRHPPRKPQRLEEEIASMAIRSPKHKMATTARLHNHKPSVQDVPEEDEEEAAATSQPFDEGNRNRAKLGLVTWFGDQSSEVNMILEQLDRSL